MDNANEKKSGSIYDCIHSPMSCRCTYTYFFSKNNKAEIIEITQDELRKRINQKTDFFVYIGRPTCKDCQKFEPVLKEFIKKSKKSIIYYNTEARASKKQKIRDYLETLGVKSIPCVLHISNGEVIHLYDVQLDEAIREFESEFKED